MNNSMIHTPFAARDYSSHTHTKQVTNMPPGDIGITLGRVISKAVSGYIEPLGNGMTRVTTIEKK